MMSWTIALKKTISDTCMPEIDLTETFMRPRLKLATSIIQTPFDNIIARRSWCVLPLRKQQTLISQNHSSLTQLFSPILTHQVLQGHLCIYHLVRIHPREKHSKASFSFDHKQYFELNPIQLHQVRTKQRYPTFLLKLLHLPLYLLLSQQAFPHSKTQKPGHLYKKPISLKESWFYRRVRRSPYLQLLSPELLKPYLRNNGTLRCQVLHPFR